MNIKQVNFAYKVRHALNENLDNLPTATTDRLAAARAKALSMKRANAPLRATAPILVPAGSIGGMMGNTPSWFNRIGLLIPLIALVAGLSGIYKIEQQKRIAETADIDTAVLSDELPLSAYLDHGFSAYLAKQAE